MLRDVGLNFSFAYDVNSQKIKISTVIQYEVFILGIRHVRHVVNSQNLRFQTVLNWTTPVASQVLINFENGFHILAQKVSRIFSIPILLDVMHVGVTRSFPVTGY